MVSRLLLFLMFLCGILIFFQFIFFVFLQFRVLFCIGVIHLVYGVDHGDDQCDHEKSHAQEGYCVMTHEDVYSK